MTVYTVERPELTASGPAAFPHPARITVDSDTREVVIHMAEPLDPETREQLSGHWRQELPAAGAIRVDCPPPPQHRRRARLARSRLADYLSSEWENLLGALSPADSGILHFSRLHFAEERSELQIYVDGKNKAVMLEERGAGNELSAQIEARTGHRVICSFIPSADFIEARRELLAAADIAVSAEQEKRRAYQRRLQEIAILGKEIRTAPEPIRDLQNREGGVATFAGKVAQYRTARAGKIKGLLHSFDLYGVAGAVLVKFVVPYGSTVNWEPKPEEWVTVRGRLVFDTFHEEVVLAATAINRIAAPVRPDTAPRKRVELHAHTKMSMRDAITPVNGLIRRAAEWGHPAIAITDHGNIQVFPEAYRLAKQHGVKLIMGVEGYMIDDALPPVFNVRHDRPLGKTPVNLLEVESSGNDPLTAEITGYIWWRMEGDEITERWEFRRNPGDEQDGLRPLLTKLGRAPVVTRDGHRVAALLRRESPRRLQNTFVDLDRLGHLAPGWQQEPGGTPEFYRMIMAQAAAQGIATLKELNRFYRRANLVTPDGRKIKVPTYHIIILVRNAVGLRNLYQLVSKSHTDYFHYQPRIQRSTLAKYRDGLIIGSACEAGEVIQKILAGAPAKELRATASFYDYLEVQPIGNNQFLVDEKIIADQEGLRDINRKVWQLGQETERLVVATSDVHFLDPEDEIYNRVLKVAEGFKDADRNVPLFFRSTDEMLEEFAYLGEDEAARVVVDNPNCVAALCETVPPIPDGFYSPRIPDAESILREQVAAGLRRFMGRRKIPEVVARAERELRAIADNSFADLYLMASRLVKKSLADGYIVGSRGSVGSSFVAYLSEITEVNPLPAHYRCPQCHRLEFVSAAACGLDLPRRSCCRCRAEEIRDGFDIPFEVFVGFEGNKTPDIDLNFSGDYQERAHQFVEEMMGEENVVRAGTVLTLKGKNTLGYARKYAEKTGQQLTWVQLRRLAHALVGVKTTNGQHPGGLVVLPKDQQIENFTPVNFPGGGQQQIRTTHFDYHAMENQLVKLDVLGHDVPTTLRLLYEYTGLEALAVPVDDADTLKLFSSHRILKVKKKDIGTGLGVLGIPEFGTPFVRRMLEATKPTSIGELIMLSGLSHGTDVWKGNADQLIKKGQATLREVIAARDDIMLYLIKAGLPPLRAFEIMERVRKGKGLTGNDEREMAAHKVPEWYIESCQKIKYMFPKAHAVAYTLMALRVAYFKIHYPAAFYAAFFTIKVDHFHTLMCDGLDACTEKIKELQELRDQKKSTQKDEKQIVLCEVAREMFARGIRFLPVDIHHSSVDRFLIEDEGLRLPLRAIDGLGHKAAARLVAARAEGPFRTVRELIDRSRLNRAQVEKLRDHGCLQSIPEREQRSLF